MGRRIIPKTANTVVCEGCGKEFDPREWARRSTADGRYCGLMCVMDMYERESERAD